MRVGLVAGFGEVIPDGDFSLLHDLGVQSVRTDLTLSPSEDARRRAVAQLEEAWAARGQVLPFYVCDVGHLDLLPAGATAELLNEPDLHGWTPARYAARANVALLLARARGITLYVGSASNCSPDRQDWLRRVLALVPTATHVSVHRYPRKHTQSPMVPHVGFRSRPAEVEALRRVVGARTLAMTEAGWHLAPFRTTWWPWVKPRTLSEDEQLTYAECELGLWREAGAPVAHLYQFQDGPSGAPIDRFGMRARDMRLRRVAEVFGGG